MALLDVEAAPLGRRTSWMNGTRHDVVGLSLNVVTPLLRENKLPMFFLILAPSAGWFASYRLVS